MTKLDSGTWVLTGNSSYKGITLLTAGTLSVSTSANLGDASNTFTFDGGTLRVTGTGLADLASRTVSYGTNKLVAIEVVDSSHTFTFSQALTQAPVALPNQEPDAWISRTQEITTPGSRTLRTARSASEVPGSSARAVPCG
ncbi:autotransporter-associated beta strand repeat-containing protein [Verrucomicrobium spinosum]|uniref:autotransporter-associated beta strand repeat-containing protein n=1 Tax=Verrucomicrobium spinosum TaxID=2736 RepID=UPI00094665A1|nr:autotransporter-associated beta strand repeat-containing protein [Verrucomicrobium spinosum]